jgi:hypothetical protein
MKRYKKKRNVILYMAVFVKRHLDFQKAFQRRTDENKKQLLIQVSMNLEPTE